MHRAYLAAGGGAGDQKLAARVYTVAVVVARSLHLIATREEITALVGRADTDRVGPMEWRTGFLDPSVLPALTDVPAGPTSSLRRAGDRKVVGGQDDTIIDVAVELERRAAEAHAAR